MLMTSLPSKAWLILHEDGVKQLCCSLISFFEGQLCRLDPYYEYKKEKIAQRCDPETDADIFKLVWIPPEEIEYLTGTIESGPSSHHLDHVDFFRGLETFGDVRGSSWDQKNELFEDLAVYRALRERFLEGEKWEDIDFYKKHSLRIEEGYTSYNCQTKDELWKKLQRVEVLYKNIKKHGYKTQSDVGSCKLHKEITVNIGRDGAFLFNGGGRHRLSIAKIQQLDEIPVIIRVRHENWQYIRDQIITVEKECQLENSIRSKLHHPDLADIRLE